ncbi:MAG TPA: ester cyclase [Candidatus Dormibacteraeota bacterium]
MAAEQNKEVVRAIQDAWNRDALDELDQYFAPDFLPQSNAPGMPPGLEGAKAAHGFSRRFLPDRKVETVELIAEGDKVLIRNRIQGVNNSGVPWLGAEANGQPYDFESWSLYTLRDGKVVEHVGLTDMMRFAIQSGAVKPPEITRG